MGLEDITMVVITRMVVITEVLEGVIMVAMAIMDIWIDRHVTDMHQDREAPWPSKIFVISQEVEVIV